MALEEAQRRLSPFSDGGYSEEKFAALAREGTIFDFYRNRGNKRRHCNVVVVFKTIGNFLLGLNYLVLIQLMIKIVTIQNILNFNPDIRLLRVQKQFSFEYFDTVL
jgi:hypothetical protein